MSKNGNGKVEKGRKVFVAMSGGVDSSVAAALLMEATPNNFEKLFGRPTPEGFRGFDVVGVHMKCWSELGDCGEQDIEDARKVAAKLDIPFYVWNFEAEYKARVVDYMIEGYRAGITPNPDIMCNREIKFGLFLEKALRLGADYVATGHYVRLESRIQNSEFSKAHPESLNPKSYILYSARDTNKDQSYFLWTLTQKQLAHVLFPIGDLLKPEVRELARKFGLPTAEKKDSQGICFMGKIPVDEFLRKYIPMSPGDVVAADGKKIGRHDGINYYTIGQRHGLNLSDKRGANSEKGNTRAHYVASKDISANTITVAEELDPALFRREVELTSVNFISDGQEVMVNGQRSVLARVRYRQPLQRAVLYKLTASAQGGSALGGNSYKLGFEQPVKFVASGQSAVFYTSEGEMLGGGVIS